MKIAQDSPASQNHYLRRAEAAQYLGCSLRQVDALKHDGELPFYRIGRRLIVFSIDDLEEFMRVRRIDV